MAALKKDQLTIDNVKFDSARIDELVRMWRESFEFGVGVADPHPIAEQSQYLITKLIYTFARNAVARAFYEKHGFRIVARGFEPTWQLADLRYEWKAQRASV